MLVPAEDREAVLKQLAGDPVRGFCLRNFMKSPREPGLTPELLVDDVQSPRVLIARAGAELMVYGALEHYNPAMKDLLEGRVETNGAWPDEPMRKMWQEWTEGRRFFFLNSTPYSVWRAARLAGFDAHPEDLDGPVAYLWYIQGEPRFGHLIKHPCRLGEGNELLERLKEGIPYDPEGHYTSQCLKHGPSFVCEVDGQPACWSCTHLNGTMGMIYTPEQHRRQGYAKSLAAFQIDHMLKRDGIACCHIIDFNTASMMLVKTFGAQRWEEPLVWRLVFWPGEAPPPEPPEEKKEEEGTGD